MWADSLAKFRIDRIGNKRCGIVPGLVAKMQRPLKTGSHLYVKYSEKCKSYVVCERMILVDEVLAHLYTAPPPTLP